MSVRFSAIARDSVPEAWTAGCGQKIRGCLPAWVLSPYDPGSHLREHCARSISAAGRVGGLSNCS